MSDVEGSGAAGTVRQEAGNDSGGVAPAKREHFGSRLGFILISAGCAIGLGNVWRFPYIVGQYGGAAFVLMILFFLVVFALPILVMEFATGRASQKGIARSYDALEPPGTHWHRFKWVALAGMYLLMMFYTVITGWMLNFTVQSAMGAFNGLDGPGVARIYGDLTADPLVSGGFAIFTIVLCMSIVRIGLQSGVERVTKFMMASLFVLLGVLCVRAVTLPGAAEGLAFYLLPDFGKLFGSGLDVTLDAVLAAMGQAFFMVSVGIGSMSIFGSYIGKTHRLTGEAITVTALDILVAIMAGLIIFPACFSYGVEPGAGPGLVFVTLPTIFAQMPLGQFWGALFFLFLSFAALSTVIAVLEALVAFTIDQWGISRSRSCLINGACLLVLAMPCVLGFNLWSGVQLPGVGNILDIEDFAISNLILPIGSLVVLLFCTRKGGWGFDAFLKEADTGRGLKFPAWTRVYLRYVLPILILVVMVAGVLPTVQTWLGLG